MAALRRRMILDSDAEPDTIERSMTNEVQRMRSAIGEMVLLDNGVIVHTLDEGALVDEAAAADVLTRTKTLSGGSPVAVVVDLTHVAFADQNARTMFATDDAGGLEVATGLVASARVAAFLAARFMGAAESQRPVQLFESVDVAVEWAAGHVAAARRA